VWLHDGNNGAEVIRSFATSDIVLDSVDDVFATIMGSGSIEYNQIVRPATATVPELQAGLRNSDPSLRQNNIEVKGLSAIR